MTALALKNVTKRFNKQTVLDAIFLEVAQGETIAIFGPSGAGKTVLLRLIAGVIDPDEGAILLDGADCAEVAPEDRGIGMAFQNFALFPHMNAFENIATPLQATGAPAARIRQGVESIARLLKIDHVLDHAPRALSNGQKQRTALARALAAGPGILLLDDPLRNVDAKLRFEMRLELPRLLARFGSTVLYVTQDYKEAMALGDRIAVLAKGRLVQVATPEQIYLRPETIDVARLFGDPTINLIEVQPKVSSKGASATVAGIDLHLGDRLHRAIDRPAVLGIRPEAIRFCQPGEKGAIPAMVEAVTPLNEKTVTLLTAGDDQELLASRPSQSEGPLPGRAVHVNFPKDHILLFDKATGRLIGGDDPA